MLSLLPEVRAQVASSEDPLKLALQFARTGNFLDFGVLTPETAHRALQDALQHTEESPWTRPCTGSCAKSSRRPSPC